MTGRGSFTGFSSFPTASVIPFSVDNDFIGLAFTLADGVHDGYAEVARPTLVSYGYDSTLGASILTGATGAAVPEPATVALLVAGLALLGVAGRRSCPSSSAV